MVTSALPYANGPIHIGHLVEYIQTDIFVRFLKLVNEDVIYCCADDTHGAPIEIKAKELGIKPEELIAGVYKEHLDDFGSFLIEFDSYYSTNSRENKEYSDFIFGKLKEKGFLEKKTIEVTYCGKCERTLPDRYVKGKCPKCGAEDQYGDVCEKCNSAYKTTDLVEPYCTVCKSAPVKKESEHYFVKLSMFSDRLKQWLNSNKRLQKEIVNFVMSWIDEGLEDWCISRDGPYFGFKIPGEEDKYYYVWLDAPVGYIASTANYCKNNNLDTLKDYWKNKDAEIIHFIGKDIIYFHYLFWPAMLMAAELELPKDIVVHGFLTVNGEKMSKSRGTFLTAKDFLKEYEPEHLRYYYASMLGRKMSDIDLSFKEYQSKINHELVANIGNFCYRTLSFLEKNFDSEVTSIDEDSLARDVLAKAEKIKESYRGLNFSEAVREILALSDIGNRYFQANEPWKLVKEDKGRAAAVLGLCANIVKVLSIVVQPVLPSFSSRLQEQLGLENLKWEDIRLDFRGKVKAEILLNKVEIKEKELFPLDLRIGKILEAEVHPDADKLYVLKVDTGERRQLVAGLKGYYAREELVGKNIIVVCNLKAAKLRGVESDGMLLAAEDGENVEVLSAGGKPGEKVEFEGLENSKAKISYNEFAKLNIYVDGSAVKYDGRALKAAEEVRVSKVKDGSRIR